MKRLDPAVKYGNVGDAYVVMEEAEDGDLVWWDEAENEMDKLRPTESDRTALATAAFELKERLGTYRAFLARCTPATDEFVVTAYKDGIAACEAAIEVVERMAKR